MSSGPPSVQVVIVAYHAVDALRDCLNALQAAVPVTVVDNSSSSSVREAAEAGSAAYLDAGRNLGFGAGVNLAVRTLLGAQPCDVLLLNPDAMVTPREIQRLARFLHAPENGRVGAVSPRLVGEGGVEQRVAWPFPSPGRAWLDAAGVGRLRARRTFVIGAVLLLRWEALQDVGLFDERFFLYAEETDWQRRALQKGWSSAVCADVVARHRGAGTSDDPRARECLFHAAHELYVRKWSGSTGWLLYRIGGSVGAAARALVLTGERRAEAVRRAMLYLRGPVRCARVARD